MLGPLRPSRPERTGQKASLEVRRAHPGPTGASAYRRQRSPTRRATQQSRGWRKTSTWRAPYKSTPADVQRTRHSGKGDVPFASSREDAALANATISLPCEGLSWIKTRSTIDYSSFDWPLVKTVARRIAAVTAMQPLPCPDSMPPAWGWDRCSPMHAHRARAFFPGAPFSDVGSHFSPEPGS